VLSSVSDKLSRGVVLSQSTFHLVVVWNNVELSRADAHMTAKILLEQFFEHFSFHSQHLSIQPWRMRLMLRFTIMTYVANKLSDHSGPRSILLASILAVTHRANAVGKINPFGNFRRKINAESFVHFIAVLVFSFNQVWIVLTQKATINTANRRPWDVDKTILNMTK